MKELSINFGGKSEEVNDDFLTLQPYFDHIITFLFTMWRDFITLEDVTLLLLNEIRKRKKNGYEGSHIFGKAYDKASIERGKAQEVICELIKGDCQGMSDFCKERDINKIL